MIIDVHAHYVPQLLLDELKTQLRLFPSVKATEQKGGLCLAFCDGQPTRPVMGRLSDLEARKKWLSEQRVDKQVVGGWLDMFAYELPAEEGADWSRFLNEHMLKGVRQLDAFTPLATVPLQSGRHAARVLAEALDAGFHGAMIGTQPKGEGGALEDPDLDPFWEVASARKATLFVHPMFACGDDRLNEYDLVNAVGRITDTTHAVARLLYSGHLTRFAGVNLVIAHGGAALPYAARAAASATTPSIPTNMPSRKPDSAGSISTRSCSIARVALSLRCRRRGKGRARQRQSVPHRRSRANEGDRGGVIDRAGKALQLLRHRPRLFRIPVEAAAKA